MDDVATVRKSAHCIGGRGAIVAAIMATLGLKTHLVTTVPASRRRVTSEFLKLYGLTESGIYFDLEDISPMRVQVTIGAKEQNCTSIFFRGTGTQWLTDIHRAQVRAATLAYFATYDLGATKELLKELRPDATVVVNATSYMLADATYRADVLSKANVVIGNRLELDDFLEFCDLTSIDALFDHAPRLARVFVTKGADGVTIHGREHSIENIPAVAANVRTPVGVGDAFAAGVLYELAKSGVHDASARLGLRLAAASLGAFNSCPTPEEVRACQRIAGQA